MPVAGRRQSGTPQLDDAALFHGIQAVGQQVCQHLPQLTGDAPDV